MKYEPETLEEAYDIASRLDYESKDGGLGTTDCDNCSEKVFVVEGASSDGVVFYGYCMNPECRYELSEDEADDQAFAERVNRQD